MTDLNDRMQAVPSVDELLRRDDTGALIESFGRAVVIDHIRRAVGEIREQLSADATADVASLTGGALVARVAQAIELQHAPRLKPVINLTGTVLHTNLGRAPLPEEAIAAVADVARGASNLEFDLERGRRGDRDSHLEGLICELTGAEAATIVNNNAAAVLLVLNTLAKRKEVIVSRGELIEIGGSFRIPDVMSRAGAKLREVGTTNRTHAADFVDHIDAKTALLMKVHTSNYLVTGFTAAVPEHELAKIAHQHELPFVVDLGSGTLLDLSRYGLPHEPTVSESLAAGADLVTFSGDKLLGGPQAGVVAGRRDLIARIKRNPMKRALRVDKMTIAALEAVLRLYRDPDRLSERSVTLRWLSRDVAAIRASAELLAKALRGRLADDDAIDVIDCRSQIGSGAQPGELLASAGVAIRPASRRGSGKRLQRIAAAFRGLPTPVIGRIEDGAFLMDVRCLESESDVTDQLDRLNLSGSIS